MKIELDELPREVQFMYIAMTKVAISMKESGFDKEFYLQAASEIWDSMILENISDIKELISNKMKSDLDNYLKQRKEKNL
jgi:hypothetical protein